MSNVNFEANVREQLRVSESAEIKISIKDQTVFDRNYADNRRPTGYDVVTIKAGGQVQQCVAEDKAFGNAFKYVYDNLCGFGPVEIKVSDLVDPLPWQKGVQGIARFFNNSKNKQVANRDASSVTIERDNGRVFQEEGSKSTTFGVE
ncbi:MAG: hypothetical protein H7A33_02030 [Deltaproteobacteria bacterium]|nr:hypothetical protein [Deltaproteobacteria bacterium]